MPDVKMWINNPLLPENLQNPVSVFKRNRPITCLIFACLASDNATVRQLVEAGADIEITDSQGYSALDYACASDIDSDAKVSYLMQHVTSSQTATGGSEEVVIEPEFYTKSLRLAVSLNLTDRVKALINDYGVPVNAASGWGSTPLHLAAKFGNAETVNVLASHPHCDFSITDGDGNTAADCARLEEHHDIAALIQAKSKGNISIIL